jgi:hypothetical protein
LINAFILTSYRGFGSVFFAQRTDNMTQVAIKKVPHANDKEQLANLKEVGFLFLGNHPNVGTKDDYRRLKNIGDSIAPLQALYLF